MANKTIALEASDTSITTATISIKVVQVGKRQLTQSTFKQLEPINLVDEDRVLLVGVPWGYVRYYWGNQEEKYTHFIVQNGALLNRSLVWIRDSNEFDPKRRRELPAGYQKFCGRMDRLCEALHCAKILARCKDEGFIRLPDDPRSLPALNYFAMKVDKVGSFDNNFYDCNPEDKVSVLTDRETYYQRSAQDLERLAPKREEMKEILLARIARITGGETEIPSIEDLVRSLKRDMHDYQRRWDELMEKLGTVEQLFIAT